MKQQLILPFLLPSFNEIIAASKTHWSKYASPKKGYDVIISALARQQLKPISKYPVDVECVWACKDKRQDPDGITAGIKFILDGLVKSNILRNDGFNEINSIHHSFVVNKSKPGVEITLKY